jgi:long-chain fatty acid transport protein
MMNMNMRAQRLFMAAAVLLPVMATAPAEAGGFTIRTHSAAGIGMALAGVAAGGDLSFVYWNPATLSDADGFEVSGQAAGIFPSFEITPDAATSATHQFLGGAAHGTIDVARSALVPAAFLAHPVNDNLTLGLSVTSPFGLSTKAPRDWAGQVYSRKSEIFSLNVNPMAAYRINDAVSIGAGLQVQYFKAELSNAVSPLPGAADATLKADDIGVGFNLGVTVRPWSGTTLGLGYRSSISHSLKGDLVMPGAWIPARARLDTPDIISFGVRQEVTDRLRLMGTVEWNNWSRLGKVPVRANTGAVLTTLHLDYRDGWLYSVGGEFDATDKLTLRAGAAYETSPITTANRDTRLPEVDQIMLSAGLTYRHTENLKFDLGYLHSWGRGGGAIDIGPGNPRFVGLPFRASSDLKVDIVTVGVSYRFAGPIW